MIWITSCIGLLLFAREGWPLVQQKQWKEFIVAAMLIGAGILLAICTKLGFHSPLKMLETWFEPIGKLILNKGRIE